MRSALWLLLVIAAGSQTPPRDAPPVREGTAVIRGRVVAADTGAPIRECQVMLSPGDARPLSARTDDQGRFAFTRLAPGRYRLMADTFMTIGRYLSISYGARLPREPGKPIELAAGQRIADIELRLPRGSVIGGRVVDEFGEPVPYVRVQALERMPNGTARQAGGYMGNSTDDLGRFRVWGLMPGEYFLIAEPQRFSGPAEDASRIQPLPTYFPGVASLSEAQAVRLKVAQEVPDLEIRLIRGRTFKITGTITDSKGQPLSVGRNTSIMLVEPKAAGGTSGHGVLTRDDGGFEIRGVKPGSYILEVRPHPRYSAEESPADAEYAHVPLTVADSDIEGLTIVTQPGAVVSGDVVFDEPPPPDAGRPLEVIAQTASRRMGLGGPPPTARVAADGTFVLRGLFLPCLIRMMNPPRGYWLASVTFDGAEITDTPTEFKPGTTSRLHIVLTRRSGELSGTVSDDRGNPVERVGVVAFSDDRARWSMFATTTRYTMVGDKALYRIMGLRPGRYYVVAIPAERGPWAPLDDDPTGRFEELAKRATVVTVVENDRQVVDLKMPAEEK